DPSPLRIHHRTEIRVGDVQHRAEVEAHGAFPILRTRIHELLERETRCGNSRVVHEDVDRAGLLTHAEDLERTGHVGLHRARVIRTTELLGHLDRAVFVDVVDPYECAGGDERATDRRAHAVT